MATKPDWSSLPSDALTSIAGRLPSQVDLLRYRAVCRRFHSLVTLSPNPRFPYPNLEISARIPSKPDPEPEPVRLMLKQSVLYAIEPLKEISGTRKKTKTWVVRVEELGSGRVSLKGPFCGKDYRYMSNKLPESLNLLDYHVKVMGKIYKLDSGIGVDNFDGKSFGEVAVSDDRSAVMALKYGVAFVWRKGDEDWTNINTIRHRTDINTVRPLSSCQNVIYHKGNFYLLCYDNKLIKVDPVILDVAEIGFDHCKIPLKSCKYLLSTSIDLFLVVKHYKRDYHGYDYDFDSDGDDFDNVSYRIRFYILKFSEEKNEFVSANDALVDSVMFLGYDFVFMFSANEFPGFRKSCVYFECYGEDLPVDEDDVLSFGDDEGDISLYDDYEKDVHLWQRFGVFDFDTETAWRLSTFPHTTFCPPPWLKTNFVSSRAN